MKQRGFEGFGCLLMATVFLAQLALAGGVIYVIIHFVRKFW